MKLTKEIIQQMIMEELERLDEKSNFPFSVSDVSTSGVFGRNKDDAKPAPKDDAELVRRLKALGALDKDKTTVSQQDVEDGATKRDTTNAKKAVKNIATGGRSNAIKKVAKDALAGTKTKTKTKTKSKKQKAPAATVKTGIGGEELTTTQAMGRKTSVGSPIARVDLDYSAATMTSGIGRKIKTGGKLDIAVADALKSFYSIPPTLLGSKMGTDTLGGRFDALAKFAQAVKSDDITKLKKLEPEQLMAAAVAYKALAALFLQFQGSSAGTVFETMIALITAGGIFGGSGGAIDNIAGRNGDVFTSAKQHANKHLIKQAAGKKNGGGLIGHCQAAKKKGKKVWYISAKKEREYIEVIFGGISVNSTTNPTKYEFFKPNGDMIAAKLNVVPNVDADITSFIKKAGGADAMRIPIIDTSAARKIESVDKMIAGALKNVKDAFLTAAMKTTEQIDLISKQNLSYTTEQDTNPSIQKAADLRNTYGEIKKQMNIMFTQKNQTTIKESKQNENNLDNILDKLIKEVILTK